jgi:hypothetical protein
MKELQNQLDQSVHDRQESDTNILNSISDTLQQIKVAPVSDARKLIRELPSSSSPSKLSSRRRHHFDSSGSHNLPIPVVSGGNARPSAGIRSDLPPLDSRKHQTGDLVPHIQSRDRLSKQSIRTSTVGKDTEETIDAHSQDLTFTGSSCTKGTDSRPNGNGMPKRKETVESHALDYSTTDFSSENNPESGLSTRSISSMYIPVPPFGEVDLELLKQRRRERKSNQGGQGEKA